MNQDKFAQLLRMTEEALLRSLGFLDERNKDEKEILRYAIGSGGKRIRPLIALSSAIACGAKPEDAAWPAAAIELLHNYTLIHDDLPSMDNDVERRGKPTVWKKYDEAKAILAGDLLQALAFKAALATPVNSTKVACALASAAAGVVAGQFADIAKSPDYLYMYAHKTGDLFVAAAQMGALAADADDEALRNVTDFAMNLGLAFQFEDDLLDFDGAASREETERLAKECTARALDALGNMNGDTSLLEDIAKMLLGRTK